MRGLTAEAHILMREKARAEENAANARRTHTAQILRVEDEKEDLRRTVRQLRAQVDSIWMKLGRKTMEPLSFLPKIE